MRLSQSRSELSTSASMLCIAPVKKAVGWRRFPALVRLSRPPTQPGGLDWACSQTTFDWWQGAAWRHLKTGQSLFAMAACGRCHGRYPICAPAWHKAALACAYYGASADHGGCRRTGQQDRTDGLGHDGCTVSGLKSRDCFRRRHRQSELTGSRNWRVHDDVMQIRSFRGLGEPAWVIAFTNARERLGPDPRRALGPAATPAAPTGRTRDRTRPMLQKRQKVLARAPSTRDPNATSQASCLGYPRLRR